MEADNSGNRAHHSSSMQPVHSRQVGQMASGLWGPDAVILRCVFVFVCVSCHAAVASMPPCPSMKTARQEFEEVMFSTVQDLFNKTGASAHAASGVLRRHDHAAFLCCDAYRGVRVCACAPARVRRLDNVCGAVVDGQGGLQC